MRTLLFLLSFILGLEPLLAMSKKSSTSAFKNEAIGVQTFKFIDESRQRPVLVEFWYPTDDKVEVFSKANDEVWIHPKEARDAKVSKELGSYPMIVMSHGHRGDRRERTWLVDALVRKGFVVASVEHHGSAWYQYDPISSFCFWDRAKDVSFAITSVLNEPSIQSAIDPERIGFVGYSMGGMTGLSLAGAEAKTDMKALALKLQGEVETSDTNAISQIDFAQATKNYREPRIRSMLLICPAAFVYLPENLQQIKIPLGIIASLEDEVLPHQEHAEKVIQNSSPKKVKLMKNKISHYAFLNRMTEKGYNILQKAMSQSTAKQNWAPIHKEAADFTLSFFEDTLQNREKEASK